MSDCCAAGSRAADRQEDPPSDHHLRLEEGHAGGARRAQRGSGGSWVTSGARACVCVCLCLSEMKVKAECVCVPAGATS